MYKFFGKLVNLRRAATQQLVYLREKEKKGVSNKDLMRS